MDPLTELLRCGAQQLIRQAVEAVLAEVLVQYVDERDGQGCQRVVRNGYLPEREIVTGVAPVNVKLPRVRAQSDRIKSH